MRAAVLVEARALSKTFEAHRLRLGRRNGAAPSSIYAVSEVDLEIRRGEVLGLVGESGSGKTTTGFMLAQLERPTSGRILFDGADVTDPSPRVLKQLRRQVQVVFQDPADSLNPRYTIRRITRRSVSDRART